MGLTSLTFSSSCAKLCLRNSQCSKQKNNSQEDSQWALDFSRSGIKKTFRAKETLKTYLLLYNKKNASKSEKFSRNKKNSLATQDTIKTEVALMLLQTEEFKLKLKTYGEGFMFINSK